MIKLQVIGHLGRDCAVNNVNGRSVINFSVAHTEKFKDSSGALKDRTIWVECAYWTDKTAIAPYLKKGQQVYAEGNPDVRAYQTGDGRQGTSLTLRVQTVQLLGGNRLEGGGSANYNPSSVAAMPAQGAPAMSSDAPPPMDLSEPLDDLPF